jgi:hypothetical protein
MVILRTNFRREAMNYPAIRIIEDIVPYFIHSYSGKYF